MFDFLEKPSIDLSNIKDITVRAGQEIKIAIPIKGWPVPTTTWEHGDDAVEKGGRNRIEVIIFPLAKPICSIPENVLIAPM